LQQRDPLAARAGRPVTLLILAAAPVFAGMMAWFNHDDIEHPWLAVLSLLLTVAASVVFGVASSPLRAPLTRSALIASVSVAFGAFLAQVMALGADNAFLRDDWAALCLGFVVLAASPYRPRAELAGIGGIAAIAIAIVTLGQIGSFETVAPPSAFAIVAALPVVALSLAAAAFSSTINASLDEWDRNAAVAVSKLTENGTELIERSVQQDRVTLLNRQVVPFFTAVVEAGALTEADRERARQLSESIRAIMVAGVNTSWLDALVDEGRTRRGLDSTATEVGVLDPERRASEMSTAQRTAVRALLGAVFGDPSVIPDSVRLSLAGGRRHTEVVLTAALDGDDAPTTLAIEPYVAVLRVVFDALAVDVVGALLTVRFSYDHW